MRYRNNFFFAGFLSGLPPFGEIFKVVLYKLTCVRTFSRTEPALENCHFSEYFHRSNMVNKPFSPAVKRAAVEMKKAGVPLVTIREQLSMSARSLSRLLKAVKENQGEMPIH